MPLDGTNENGRYLLQRAYDVGITDPRELSVFMGQMEVESGRFRQLEEGFGYSGERLLEVFPGRNGMRTREQAEEISSRGPEGIANTLYGGRWGERNLGNTEEGDGWRFRGRGFVQLTGRANYANAEAELGVDIVNNPDIVAERDFAADASIHYWRERVVRHGAQLDPDAATPRINSGSLHAQERRESAARWQGDLTPEIMQQLERGEIDPRARESESRLNAPGEQPRTDGQNRQESGDQQTSAEHPQVQESTAQARTDHRLLGNIRSSLAEAEQGLGKPWDDASERMTASLYGAARERGFTGSDELRVAFNQPTDRYQSGEFVFLQRTGATASPDPYANRVSLSTTEAIARPADQIMQHVQSQELDRDRQQQVTQQDQQLLQESKTQQMRLG
jgi:predicted chitinase